MSFYRRAQLFNSILNLTSKRINQNQGDTNHHQLSRSISNFAGKNTTLSSSQSYLLSASKHNCQIPSNGRITTRHYHYQHKNVRFLSKQRLLKILLSVSGVSVFGICSYGVWISEKETVPYTKRVHSVKLSHEEEKRSGNLKLRTKKKICYNGKILSDSDPRAIKIVSIAQAILSALHRGINEDNVWHEKRNCDSERNYINGLQWEVCVVDKPEVNIYSLPGGKIIIYTGLLQLLANDDEIAAVIGHEFGHIIARHYAEQYIKKILIGFALFVVGNLDATFLWFQPMSRCLMKLPLFRKQEIEADHIGLLLMASAGFDPRIAPGVIKKLDRGELLDNYRKFHPSGKKRVKVLAHNKLMEEAVFIYREVGETPRVPQWVQEEETGRNQTEEETGSNQTGEETGSNHIEEDNFDWI